MTKNSQRCAICHQRNACHVRTVRIEKDPETVLAVFFMRSKAAYLRCQFPRKPMDRGRARIKQIQQMPMMCE